MTPGPFDRDPRQNNLLELTRFIGQHQSPSQWYDQHKSDPIAETEPEIRDWLKDYLRNELRRSAVSGQIDIKDTGILNHIAQAIYATHLNVTAQSNHWNLATSRGMRQLAVESEKKTTSKYIECYRQAILSAYIFAIALETWSQVYSPQHFQYLQRFKDFPGQKPDYWSTQPTKPVQYQPALGQAATDFTKNELLQGMMGHYKGIIYGERLLTEVAAVVQLTVNPNVPLEALSGPKLRETIEDAIALSYSVMLGLRNQHQGIKNPFIQG
ncbi:MAG: hypothetical protein HYV33_03645 [Candidatus Kerfeldbacteria bacterium]|nr:hypothetical protein [Candidatus Kerfeldbacteria bacterium]